MALEQDRERLGHPLPRFYFLSVVGALLIVALILTGRDLGGYGLGLVLMGALGALAKSRVMPVLVLGLLVAMLLARARGYDLLGAFYQIVVGYGYYRSFPDEFAPNSLFDALLALAMLVYFQGHYRLCALLGSALPGEGRSRVERRTPIPRDPGASNAVEGIQGLTVALGCVVLAILTWTLVYHAEPLTELSRDAWRMILLVWLLASALIVTTTVARIAFWRTAPPEVHRLFLQDTLWRETRAEQTRINRWVTAARLKAQKKKERS